MNSVGRILGILLVGGLTGCATIPMPSNVTTMPGNASGDYISSIDFSYQSSLPASFNKLKLCVAENVSNRAVQLTDSAGSFVGPATGHYYNVQHSQTVQGGDIFKYADASLSTLIANGTADGGPVALGLTRDIIKYDLKASTHGSQVGLVFTNITRAQQSTGSVANDGFSPVGTWSGAHPKQVYTALESIANGIKGCLQLALLANPAVQGTLRDKAAQRP